MPSLAPEGIILRGSLERGYTLVDFSTGEQISEVFAELQPAIDAALNSGATTIWQENLDNRGRALGPPTILVSQKLKSI